MSAIPTPYTDVMIDIEGCSDLPDAAPHEIALVFFDLHAPSRPPECVEIEVAAIHFIARGFSITADTLLWWDKHLRKPINLSKGEDFEETLDTIARSIPLHSGDNLRRVWSRGNSYDLSILRLAFRRAGRPLPWKYWLDRDVRTWLESGGFPRSSRKNNHHALSDALNQVADLHDTIASANLAAKTLA